MKISIISFSRSGYRIGEMLSWFLGEGGHEVEAFTKSKYTKKILDESQVEADDKAFRNVKEFAKPIDSSLRDGQDAALHKAMRLSLSELVGLRYEALLHL